jgi:hypothetical protein
LALVNSRIQEAKTVTLDPLLRVTQPSDSYKTPSWRRGLIGAKNILAEFHIAASDAKGADKFFERLHIDPTGQENTSRLNEVAGLPLTGAVDRLDTEIKMTLLPPEESRRRFAAARAVYLAWVSEPNSRRLVTAALTRDQQASRQFAAEILVPREFLDSQARGGKIYNHQLLDIARTRRVAPDVVRHQAHNMGIMVSSI